MTCSWVVHRVPPSMSCELASWPDRFYKKSFVFRKSTLLVGYITTSEPGKWTVPWKTRVEEVHGRSSEPPLSLTLLSSHNKIKNMQWVQLKSLLTFVWNTTPVQLFLIWKGTGLQVHSVSYVSPTRRGSNFRVNYSDATSTQYQTRSSLYLWQGTWVPFIPQSSFSSSQTSLGPFEGPPPS